MTVISPNTYPKAKIWFEIMDVGIGYAVAFPHLTNVRKTGPKLG